MTRRRYSPGFEGNDPSARPTDQTQPRRRGNRTRRIPAYRGDYNPAPGDAAHPYPQSPEDTLGRFQPMRPVQPPVYEPIPPQPRRRGCGCRFTLLLLTIALLLAYLLFPLPTTFLVLGLDRAPEGTDASRTDTNILARVDPLDAHASMLSIPRDLWVPIAGVGENRINTAHYFAELSRPGTGPQAALDTVQANFGVEIRYYIRIRFDGLRDIVDSMGGLTVELEEPMSGYEAGTHKLDGEQALAFARDRAGSDDFFRMQRGQLVIRSALKQMANPAQWLRIPLVLASASRSVDTNLPAWQLPRIALALIRSIISDALDTRIISRDMVTPFTTSEGANVLLPDWNAINQLTAELFGS